MSENSETVERLLHELGEIKQKVTTTEALLKTHIKAFSDADAEIKGDVATLKTRLYAFETDCAVQATRLEGKLRTVYALGSFIVGLAVVLSVVLQFVKISI